MELESYAHAREDMTAHRLIDLRNQIAFDTAKAEQMLARVGDELDPAYRSEIEQAMRELRRLGESESDPDVIHKALNDFDRKTIALAEKSIVNALRSDNKE